VIDKNPPVFSAKERDSLSYQRTPLHSAREEDAKRDGKSLPHFPVEAISFNRKEAEAPDVVRFIEEIKGHSKCKWKDFAILYRSHIHRDETVQELAEHQIPYTIENMDVSDTSEVRDLFACADVVVDMGSDASLFRVAALPQFNVDPEELRTALRALAKDSKEGETAPLSSVLHKVPGGDAVIASVKRARAEVMQKQAKTRVALQLIAKQFGLDLTSSALQAALKFASDWENKATTETGELGEWIEYLGYFREAGGVIPMAAKENEDAVHLITAHGAKGLEFSHVVILRATGGSFPTGYRESLVEFPKELRDPDSAAAGDDRTLHDQEERRLFYVTMTRAKDSLHIYGKQGIGRDKTPAGYMREMVANPALQPWLSLRSALPSQPGLIEIAAGTDESYPESSKLAAWLALPAIEGLDARLSASAVETYETCPLQFKFEREWKLSRQLHAAVQYGAAVHRVLRTYYDSVRLGRPKTDEELIQLFCEDLADCKIEEVYQHDLYLKQGVLQLREFLQSAHARPSPETLHTEEWFDIQVGATKVAGRIDRMDRASDGTVRIVDYKTGKARPQEDADESLQLSIYAIAAREKWGYQVGEVVFHNLEGNVEVVSRRTDFQLEQARERVRDAALNIAEGNFNPKLGFHCTFCAFRGLCPAREKQLPRVARDAASESPLD
jgi:DNA helicase-2/ATP-dependent DNA helicase PcrA